MTPKKGSDKESGISEAEYTMACVCTLAAALVKAVNTVVAQLAFKKKSSSTFATVAEGASANGLISFVTILPFAYASGEMGRWDSVFNMVDEAGNYTLFWVVIVMIGVCKQLGYLFKFAAVAVSSAVYVEVLDTQRRVLVVFLLVWLLGEALPPLKALALFSMVVGFGVYIYGGHILKKRKSAVKQSERETIRMDLRASMERKRSSLGSELVKMNSVKPENQDEKD